MSSSTPTTSSSSSPITVLIEQPDFVPYANNAAALRRASLTPSASHHYHSSAGFAHAASTSSNSPHNSIKSIPAGGGTPTDHRNPNRSSISSAGGNHHSAKEWNRRQRTSTTFHASIDAPDSLLAALSSIAIVSIQPSLLPLPPARPLVVLIQLNDYIPQELSTTPSSICFPPNATPTKQSIQRAIQPLKTAIAQLPRAETAFLLYSDNAHLPPEIPQAAFAEGAHGLLTPPFTPDSVQSSLHAALELFQTTRHAAQLSKGPGGMRPPPRLPEPVERPERRRGGQHEHHKWDSLDSFTLDSSSSHGESPPRPTARAGGPGVDDDNVDPLDTSRRRRSMVPAPLDADGDFIFAAAGAQGTRGTFPLPDYSAPRRASVDLGGLQLALPRSDGSPSSPISPPSGYGPSASSSKSGYSPSTSSPTTTRRSGWGWAGFDTSPAVVGLDLAGNGPGAGPWGRRGTVVPGRANADVRALKKKAASPAAKTGIFDDDEEDVDGLGVADLLLAMHLHGSAALENAAALSQGVQPPTTSSYFSSDAPIQRRQSSPGERSTNSPYGVTANNGTPPPPLPPLPFPSILTATPRTLSRLRALLSSWHFEPYLLSPPETLLCVQLIFEALLGALKLTPKTLKGTRGETIGMATHLVPFLTDLMRLYRRENRYH
ncbi:hypothetical protein M408DRAFT_329697, partial [Serendipita vermifera MAFF 305830]